jgi:hypothetical protein
MVRSFEVSKNQGLRVTRCQGFEVSGLRCFKRVLKNQNFEFLGIRFENVRGNWVLRF